MNERIDELAFAAGCHRHKYWDPKHPDLEGFIINQAALDKFAELIAKECAQLAMTQHHSTSPADYGDMEPYEQGCDDTASAISGLIRRTFGVE